MSRKSSRQDGQSDLIFWRWEREGETTFNGYVTDAKGAVIRRQGRRITYAGGIEGTYLKGKGVDLSGDGLVE
ncbi:MAG: hypothetical protein O7G87_22965 [bacterium]|nr:hypothetical protein [bacterium]